MLVTVCTDDKSSETEKDEGDANSQFYDKKKSFFDSISCQSLGEAVAPTLTRVVSTRRRLATQCSGEAGEEVVAMAAVGVTEAMDRDPNRAMGRGMAAGCTAVDLLIVALMADA